MTSVVKIYTGDLLRHPDVTWDLAVISQDIEQLSDAFLFFIDTSKVYDFIRHLQVHRMSYEAYIKPAARLSVVSHPKNFYTHHTTPIEGRLVLHS